jgi:adenylate kinase family enzyme
VAGPNRILIYGVTGSGKTTLASAVAARTGIPWHSIDDLMWEPGWRPVEPQEQRRRAEAICAQDRWILDTAYGEWRDVPLARADLIVALDYPRLVSLRWLVRRTIARTLDKRPVCNGNTESWRLAFSKESIVLWHFRSFSSKRRQIRSWAAGGVDATVLRMTSHQATQAWLDTLGPT